jgi:hypothetical protein
MNTKKTVPYYTTKNVLLIGQGSHVEFLITLLASKVSPNEHSCQIRFKWAMLLQRRRLKCEKKLTDDDGHKVMTIVHLTFGSGVRTKKD